MTARLRVSVVVVSRGRPEALARCATALTQLNYAEFEIVVIADGPGLNRIDMLPELFGRIKRRRFDDANISHARNLGVALAAGEIVAFIDDDAVPEPAWLDHLATGFGNKKVMSVGGTVIGRNGFSVQWGPRCIYPTGDTNPVEVRGIGPTVFPTRPGVGIKTEGTNMAFRRSILAAMGGFDPALRFYHDETDVNLRLATESHAAALVPSARVHHGYLASERRRADRVPIDLSEIGAGLAVFLRKHVEPSAAEAAIAAERAARRRGLLAHMVAGRIEPRDVDRLLSGFDRGVAEGRTREIGRPIPLPDPTEAWLPFRRSGSVHRPPQVLTGRSWQRDRILQRAAALAREGVLTTAFVLSPDARPHRMGYRLPGFWVQSGGLFGPSVRSDPPFRFWSFRRRIARETALLAQDELTMDP